MSKHISAEEKLRVAKQLRGAIYARQQSLKSKARQLPSREVPSTGTNANNQYK